MRRSGDTNIRPAEAGRDAAGCAAIYEHYVLTSPATFELEPPTPEEMARRIAAAHLWLVAEVDGAVAGFAYASEHRSRPAYRFAADTTVYVAPGAVGTGLGRALYEELLPRLRDLGIWTAVAGISLPNRGSERLHRSLGFESVGVYPRIGWKGGRWHDVEWLTLDLRPGDESNPETGGQTP